MVLAADAVNAAEGWPKPTKKAPKAPDDLIDTKMWGIDLEGNTGIVSISRERRVQSALLNFTYIHKK